VHISWQRTDQQLIAEVIKAVKKLAGSNTSTVTLRVIGGNEKGSLKSETVKYGYESEGTRSQERLHWRVPAAYTNDPSSRQRGRPQKQGCNCQRLINIWS
jgi:hypothetical protein